MDQSGDFIKLQQLYISTSRQCHMDLLDIACRLFCVVASKSRGWCNGGHEIDNKFKEVLSDMAKVYIEESPATQSF
jgi:hypothetical protein